MQKLMNNIKGLVGVLLANVLGIPTPYGFKLKPRAFMVMKGLSDEVQSLKVRYDYAMKVNEQQASKINALHAKAFDYHSDAAKLSRAMKELVNHPHVLSPETMEIVKGFKNEETA